MNRVNVRRLVKRPKGTEVRLSPINERLSSVLEYRTLLRKMLREMAKEIRESIIPAYQAHRRGLALIHDGEEWLDPLRRRGNELIEIAKAMVRRILNLEAKRHSAAFMRSATAAFGIDLKAVIREEDLEDYLQDVLARNVSLIKSLADDTLKGIEQAVYAAKIEGRSVAKLRKELQKVLGKSAKRADLIAQDQLSKLTADLNERRQTQIGVEEYDWFTSRDERVRARHRKLDGKRYRWGEPTGAEEGLPPGKPIRCRCVAIGVVRF